MCPVRNVTYVSGRSALTGFGWQATDVDRRRVSPEAPQERRETAASTPPACKKAKSVTHASGTKCHLCLGPLRCPAGFGWRATDVDRRRVSPEAPQERRETGAMWYVYFLKLSNNDIYVGSTNDL